MLRSMRDVITRKLLPWRKCCAAEQNFLPPFFQIQIVVVRTCFVLFTKFTLSLELFWQRLTFTSPFPWSTQKKIIHYFHYFPACFRTTPQTVMTFWRFSVTRQRNNARVFKSRWQRARAKKMSCSEITHVPKIKTLWLVVNDTYKLSQQAAEKHQTQINIRVASFEKQNWKKERCAKNLAKSTKNNYILRELSVEKKTTTTVDDQEIWRRFARRRHKHNHSRRNSLSPKKNPFQGPPLHNDHGKSRENERTR